MQDIIKPIDRALLKAELTGDKKLRRTNKSNNEIYIVTAHDSPNVMQEIGRLRETAFRYYGGGTGFPVDIDEYDTMDDAYRQLIVWSPEDEQILGGYRFLCGSDVKFDEAGKPVLATSHLFNFSDTFNKEYLAVHGRVGPFVRDVGIPVDPLRQRKGVVRVGQSLGRLGGSFSGGPQLAVLFREGDDVQHLQLRSPQHDPVFPEHALPRPGETDHSCLSFGNRHGPGKDAGAFQV